MSDFHRERTQEDDLDIEALNEEAALPNSFNPWIKVIVHNMPFADAILAMRLLETYAEDLDDSRSYISILSTFSHLPTLPLY